ncbi:MAG: hypothetical protein UV58_C0001G0029 [Candidatus Wolfebacteria bacterium GW2011_GWC1_43_10]|uniref:Uncharacterized protein n=2 Tax=Candidatus Wolfeibacteriota TaxID=1752735 RepID=A0A0G1CC48_9BACT|nr:MAG: hypothetical protein UV58_C0001G0029 [Candidatus Wolfebacteria bacterium GW2011_GWC1_43_10]KKT22728.1 MAG: hypothetical protein UW08_C0004G0024 [Parcubacteria group bacterium GW2011_GWB1_43_8b]OGM90061.1 MAG: hypothetical protein A2108_01855 [Candidatus Wolfebacteria bacterium GWA1_42_9]
MKPHFWKRENFWIGLVVLVITFILSSLVRLLGGVFPNFELVLVLALSFFISDFWYFLIFLGVSLVWFKFLPFLVWEHLFFFGVGFISFVILRTFLSKRSLVVFLTLLLFWQIIFWVLFGNGPGTIISLSFLTEFIYGGILGSLFFILESWVKKRFS